MKNIQIKKRKKSFVESQETIRKFFFCFFPIAELKKTLIKDPVLEYSSEELTAKSLHLRNFPFEIQLIR